ncbi:MAG: DUF2334 domain-containing protein [Sulfuriferula sp.]
MPDQSVKQAMNVVLHDVTPQSWPVYQDFIHAVDTLGHVPLTLLVVPDFHHQFHLDRFPEFRNAIDRRIARGDEVVLHGYSHHDDSPLRPNPVNWFMRRIYTHEGEFYSLDEIHARQRLEQGLELFHRYRWPVSGFVAPAWLMSKGTQAALRGLPLQYTSDLTGLIRLPDWQHLDTPTLVWSSRSAWRRRASRHWNQLRLKQSLSSPLLRLGLHPIDMRYNDAVLFWLETLEALLTTRIPLTKAQWMSRYA